MKLDLASQIASDVVVHSKYAKYLPALKRRETWEEVVTRYKNMMLKKYPQLEELIESHIKHVFDKNILPSMRMLQFAGAAIEKNNARGYNCSFMCADSPAFFKELMFLLLGGTGVGFSVQGRHIKLLPTIVKPTKQRKWMVGDSIEGWADSINGLFRAFFEGKPLPRFDYSDVREKGAILVTAGGKAPGPAPLRVCHDRLLGLLENKPEGSSLTSVEVSDLACFIADAVLAGGIRRAAMIALFDKDDESMLAYKSPCVVNNFSVVETIRTKSQDKEFTEYIVQFDLRGKVVQVKISEWELTEHTKTGKLQFHTVYPERARVNVSASLKRGAVTEGEFHKLMKATEDSNSGEPGVWWTNDLDQGTNPCGEIGLRSRQFCNLTTINLTTVRHQSDLVSRAQSATFFGTLQAGFTDFHYLHHDWEDNTKEEALLGVSMTGIGDCAIYHELDFTQAAKYVSDENNYVARLIGIKTSARLTCIKPEGTASLVLGTSSGVHGRHAPFYIRRFRFKCNESIIVYFASKFPNLVVEDLSDPDCLILELPQKSPLGAFMRDESAIEQLERAKFFQKVWVRPGHRSGPNTHNVSVTVSVREDEWGQVANWMWENREGYNGISLLPFDGGNYLQAPFEECTEAHYEAMMCELSAVDMTEIIEYDDETARAQEAACSGNGCAI